ncbi:DUF6049 family protein [Actinokineospora soli]|uniref:DUF6049 family protein n=1 Tax=Actinokineospora soli TaxID=1048753 RepID=A0ABW2TWY4_9PSEU
MARADGVQRELVDKVLFEDAANQVTPTALMAPLRRGLVRASSTAWRAEPRLADQALARVTESLNGMLDQVSVTDPGRPLSLASKDSPLPVYISNKLPVEVLARINVGTTPACDRWRRRWSASRPTRASRGTCPPRSPAPAGSW